MKFFALVLVWFCVSKSQVWTGKFKKEDKGFCDKVPELKFEWIILGY